jgi:sulfur-oxidizing protein SoxY
VDDYLLSRRAIIRAGLLGTGIAVFHPAVAFTQSREGEHLPKLELPFLAENPAAVPVRVSVDHPMEPGHFIKSIEIVLDKDPVPHKGTYRFTPANGQAWVAFAMRSGTGGIVKATAECSRHGRFVATREIRVTSDGCATDTLDKDRLGNPRLRLVRPPKPGEVVEVRTKIDHGSDTGLTLKGATYVRERPEFFISRMRVSFERELVSEFQLTSAVSSNPLIKFPFKVTRAGTLRVLFVNNEGRRWEIAEPIRPAG